MILRLLSISIAATSFNPQLITAILCIVVAIAGGVLYFTSKHSTSRTSPAVIAVFRAAGASDVVASYLARDEVPQAIQSYHEEMNVSLSEAKKAIEQILLSATEPETLRKADIPANVIALMEQGNKIAAIKAYSAEKQVSLREAKETIEQLMRR